MENDKFSSILKWIMRITAGLTLFVVVFMIGYILVKGVPNLKPSLFAWNYTSENVSLMPALINTILMTAISLLIAIPIGILTAIYLVEYSKSTNIAVRLIRIAAETLSGIPSIVYGLFGMLFFVIFLGWGYSLLAGAFTLSAMVLPLIIRTSEEALIAVPDMYREAGFGLGAGKVRTIFVVILPSAVKGIMAGIVLAIGRIVGETAALIFTAGTVAQLPSSMFSSVRTLSVHMYSLSNEGLYVNQTYATAVVLLVLVILINWLSSVISNKIKK